ncbi:ATP-binding cassette domain-containing protein [Nitrosococcus wardiae]|uniref:ATP-binding cassette domain-containing protein n=1 Tax=Nitrosococcus wardiae TaxID=1814290 RepID=A0A4P7BZL8_9GAMM|nr:ATP-binding cassette domain-containing protein [Nitrosococcus wardiae]QBQ54807.1 ATP-binding cassette domain-containing protein [Nitrosococcus wardiae]
MLELEAVSKRYGGAIALHATDLSISPGRTTVLIGPSGCGKSTLLRLMIGLIQPDTGSIRFGGTLLTAANILEQRREMGYVIQEGGLFPHFTAQGNITLVADHLGWDKVRIQQRLGELVILTRFPSEALDRYPTQLSGGQRQRVALMRALMLDPDLLLLDEPLGALDPLNRYELQSELKNVFRSLGKTVVMVTHDMGEAAYFGDHIVLLQEGTIVQQGKIQDFVERPETPFVERFIQAQRSPLEVYEKSHPK